MKRFLLWAGGAVVALVLLSCGWLIYGNQDPAFSAVQATMPSPNARDYYIKAGGQMRDVMRIGLGPAADNPRIGPEVQHPMSIKRELLNENAGALRTLRSGLRYRFMAPIPKVEAPEPLLARYRDLELVLRLEQEVRAANGDWVGSMSSCLDGIKLGEDVANGGGDIGLLISVACQAIARWDAWHRISHLSGAQAHDAARRLERILSDAPPLPDVCRAEKGRSLQFLAGKMHKPDWPTVLAKEVVEYQKWSKLLGQLSVAKAPEAAPAEAALSRQIRIYGKRLIFGRDGAYHDARIAVARQPYAAKTKPPDQPSDPYHRYFSDLFASLRFTYTKNEAANRLLVLSLALQAYRSEHGIYPESLESLSPGYIKQVPQDPFALNQAFRYRMLGSRYVLYSLGPDCADDGGRPAVNTLTVKGAPNYGVQMNSIGDFVAGVSF